MSTLESKRGPERATGSQKEPKRPSGSHRQPDRARWSLISIRIVNQANTNTQAIQAFRKYRKLMFVFFF